MMARGGSHFSLVELGRTPGPRRHLVQHTVRPEAGVTVPTGCPPTGAQLPPLGVLAAAIAEAIWSPLHPMGAVSRVGPPVQFVLPKAVTVVGEQTTPVGEPQAHGVQALPSVDDL